MSSQTSLRAPVILLAAGLLTGACVVGDSSGPARPSGHEVDAASITTVTRAKTAASVSATYEVTGSGSVKVVVESNAKYLKVSWKSATGRARTKKIRVRGGSASTLLPAGATGVVVRALGTSRLFATGWVVAGQVQPAAEAEQAAPGGQNQPAGATPPAASAAQPASDVPGDYSFLSTQPSDPASPVAWSTCEPIRVRVDPGDPSLGVSGEEVSRMEAAVASLAAASRLPITYAGQTRDQSPDPADTEIIVRFLAGPLEGGAAGFGGYSSRTYLRAPDRALWQFIDYGHVELSVGEISRTNPEQRLELYMHELAHAIGLGHASSTSQVMYMVDDNPGVTPVWGSGDLAGLAKLAAGPCRAAG